MEKSEYDNYTIINILEEIKEEAYKDVIKSQKYLVSCINENLKLMEAEYDKEKESNS